MSLLSDGMRTVIDFALSPSTDGFQSTNGALTLSGFTAYVLEKEVQPPALDGKGPIEMTNMRNTYWRTQLPKSLISLDDLDLTVEYDPAMYNDFPSTLIQLNGKVSIQFPDTNVLAFYAWLDKITPSKAKEGDLPTAELKICISNMVLVGSESGGGAQEYEESGPTWNGALIVPAFKGNSRTPPGVLSS